MWFGTGLAMFVTQKKVRTMKIATSFLAGLLFIGSLGAINSAMAADGILSKDEFTAGSYCHMKFPAIDEEILGDNRPVLTQTDIIDFYGPCDENPVGEDQVQAQMLENQHRWASEYATLLVVDGVKRG